MEKVIDFRRDPIFRRAVHLNENRNYHVSADAVSEAVRRRAAAVSDRILVLAQRGKLDATDMQIIAMRQRSPMPTWREMGNELHMRKQSVHERAEKIKTLVNTGL